MSYVLHLLVLIALYAVAALALNLVVGYGGLMSLAHGAFFAIGAYTFAVLVVAAGVGQWKALLLGGLLAMAVSPLLGIPALHVHGDYFALVSLALQALVFSLITNWFTYGAPIGSLANLTNGSYGISLPVVSDGRMPPAFAPALVVLAVALVMTWALSSAPWGRLAVAIRDDELLARGLGKRTGKLKMELVAASCFLAGLAGAVYAWQLRYVDPSLASLNESILVLAMVLVGGSGNLRGPVVGALLLLLLPEVLRGIGLPVAMAANLRAMFYGVVLIAMMHWRPRGLVGSYALD